MALQNEIKVPQAVIFDQETKKQKKKKEKKNGQTGTKATIRLASTQKDRINRLRKKGTSRQRSGKGAIRKRFPL